MKFTKIIMMVAAVLALAAASAQAAGDKGKGQGAYMANCIACHNMDPAKDGAVGPAIKGASRELIEARVIKAVYPAGYKPKRTTKLMPPMPHLAGSIDDLAAFLK